MKVTNTFIFTPKKQVPKNIKVTYGKIVCELKPEKEEKERTILTIRENVLDFTVHISAPTSSITTLKCGFDSVVYTPGARCLLANINVFP